MNLIKLHAQVLKFPKELKKILTMFISNRNRRGCNALLNKPNSNIGKLLRDSFKSPINKIAISDLHTALTGEASAVCLRKGCTNKTNYCYADRKFRACCSKKCANISGYTQAKREEVMLDRHGVKNPYQMPSTKKKIEETNLKKYGVKNPSSSEKVKLKRKKTFQDRYGINSPMESSEFKDKQRAVLLENHGVDNPMKSSKIRSEMSERFRMKHGVTNPMQVQEFVTKSQKNYELACIKKYGVRNAMQSPEILKIWSSAQSKRTEISLCGTTLNLQGYEEHALNCLYRSKPFKSITNDPTKMPQVNYTINGKSRVYLPDAAIKMFDESIRVIEVKSWYTLSKKDNYYKFRAATKFYNSIGVDFILVIVDDKTGALKILFNPYKGLRSLIRAAKVLSSGRRTW
jgi:hypothetical protein